MRKSLHQIITFHHFLPSLLPTTMSSNAVHEGTKIQEAIALLRKYPSMKATEAARKTRASYCTCVTALVVFCTLQIENNSGHDLQITYKQLFERHSSSFFFSFRFLYLGLLIVQVRARLLSVHNLH